MCMNTKKNLCTDKVKGEFSFTIRKRHVTFEDFIRKANEDNSSSRLILDVKLELF
ncbi:hypothetical protein Hanom_Chr16g01461871 [Helianthus anomalus]